MQLFPITLPKQHICNETALYYRTSDPVQYDKSTGAITMYKNTVLSLDTYFNCFSYSKYLQYTHAKVLEVHMQVQGDVQLCMMKAELINGKIHRTEKVLQTVHHAQMDEAVLLYDFSKESGNGILYVEAKVLSAQAAVQFGYYASPVPAEQLNDTRLAAVICTYKREAYVKRNLNHLSATILADEELQQHIEIMVIDNGKTLQKDEIEQANIKLYPNKNCGGSGGFTRGIIEALNRKDEFSHVLLMDDDILLESNVLVKTIRFLQILREEHTDLTLGGSMLRLDDMTVQHEAGGRWTGYKVETSRANISLIEIKNILHNEIFDKTDFCGWWYVTIPLEIVDKNNLPMPYFIKNDDIEFGLRITKKLDFLNGIGVWHEPFEKKLALPLEYYYTRNIIITNIIHEKPVWNSVYTLIRRVGKCMLRKNYTEAEIPLLALDDAIAGIDAFKSIQPDIFHKKLIEMCSKYNLIQKEKCAFLKTGITLITYCVKLFVNYPKIQHQYRSRYREVCNYEYWCKLLELD